MKDQFKDQPVFGFRRNKDLGEMINLTNHAQTTLNTNKGVRNVFLTHPAEVDTTIYNVDKLC